MTAEQVEELRLKGGAAASRVEIVDEGVLLLIEHQRGVEAGAEPFGQQGLARADGALNGEIPELQVPEV